MIKTKEGFSNFDICIMIVFMVAIGGFLYLKYNQDNFIEKKISFVKKGETHYLILGVDTTASKQEITKQYRLLSRRWYYVT